MDKKELAKMDFATQSIHAGDQPNQFGALAAPIYATSTFIFDSAEQGGKRFALEEEGYIYSRISNPTVRAVEEKIAALEGAEDAVAAASGMGAITSAIWMSVSAGDHIIAAKTLYGCTYAFLNHGITRFGVEVSFVDTSNLEEVEAAFQDNTKLVYLETPANPNLNITDIKSISEMAHKREGCKVIVDGTFTTPYIQKPLELGADAVVHSATKYLNGHGDVVAGFVAGSQEFMNAVRLEGIKDMTGSVLSAFDAFLIARGLKTLELRMEKHCANAMEVAKFLEGHELVEKVYYPGLESFEQYELAKEQMKLPGAMISFVLKGGLEEGKTLMNSVELAKLAVSLGDAETLIQHPASMTHSPYTQEERLDCGIAEGLVRLSVGLEGAQDIINDLDQALAKIK